MSAIVAVHTAAPVRRAITILMTIVFAVILLDIPAFVYTQNDSILPRHWFAAIVAVTAFPLACLPARDIWHRSGAFVTWSVVASCLTWALGMLPTHSSDEVAATRALSLLFGAYLGVVCALASRDEMQRVIDIVFACAVASLVAGFFLPERFGTGEIQGTVIARASAFWTNPNKAAEAVLLLCLLAFARSGPIRRMCLLIAAVTAILLTFSRGALLSWAVFVVIAAWLRMVPRAAVALPVLLLIALPLISSFFQNHVVGWLEIEAGAANVIDRIDGIVKLELDDESTSERLTALDHATEAFVDAPIFGAGIGWLEERHGVGAHNEFLLVAAEYGIAGLVLLFILFGLVWRGDLLDASRAYRWLVLAVLASLSMFTHNMLEFPYWLLALALLTSVRAHGAAEQR